MSDKRRRALLLLGNEVSEAQPSWQMPNKAIMFGNKHGLVRSRCCLSSASRLWPHLNIYNGIRTVSEWEDSQHTHGPMIFPAGHLNRNSWHVSKPAGIWQPLRGTRFFPSLSTTLLPSPPSPYEQQHPHPTDSRCISALLAPINTPDLKTMMLRSGRNHCWPCLTA